MITKETLEHTLRPVLFISTAHITEKDGRLIGSQYCPRRIAERDDKEASLFWIEESTQDGELFRSFGFSDDFIRLKDSIAKAYPKGVYVMLDAEGEHLEGVPEFDW